jgi:hypothetical protein
MTHCPPGRPCCCSWASAPSWQDRPSPPFATRTDLVLVDFVVLDKSDRVVTGLTAEDFVVEDGKVRPSLRSRLRANSPCGCGARRSDRRALSRSRTPPAPTPSAVTVVFVDDGQMSPAGGAPCRRSRNSSRHSRNETAPRSAGPGRRSLAEVVEGNRATFPPRSTGSGVAASKITRRSRSPTPRRSPSSAETTRCLPG